MGGLDAAFLYGETPSWHMHVSAVLIADPSSIPGGFDVERLERTLLARLGQAPQFRWKYVEVPLGLDRPVWVEDRDFDIGQHVRRVAVPAPGGPDELGRLVGDLVAIKLDRRRPLWEMWVIEGLADGGVAVLAKVHHAIIDGVSGAELATVLLDLSADPGPPPAAVLDTLHHVRVPSAPELLARGLVHTAFTPWRTARYAGQLVRQGLTVAGFARRARPPTYPFQAPRTSLNAAISPHRRFATGRVELARVKEVKDAFSVKLNDVVLALVGGALRRYLADRDELPGIPLVAQVPVSLRADDDHAVGNKVGAMFAALATHLDDPVERLRAIHESTASAKEMQQALSAQKIMGLTDTTPPGLLALAARTYSAAGLDGRTPPVFNVIVSNVPGPPMPLYVAGAEVRALYPMGPLLYGGGLNVTVLSYRGSLDFGFMSCATAVPEPGLIAAGLEPSLAELEAAAGFVAADGDGTTADTEGADTEGDAGADAAPDRVVDLRTADSDRS